MVVLLAAVLSLATSQSSAPVRVDGPDQVAAIVVRGGRWQGAAVVWDAPARRLMTALHVVEEMPLDGIEVVLPHRGPARARIVDRDAALDLALLQIEAGVHDGPRIGSSAEMASGDVVVLPSSCGEPRCAPQRATVVATARAFAGSRYLVVAASVRPGASGGPVLDARGALVGIVDLVLLREPGTTLAIPIDRALERFPRTSPLVALPQRAGAVGAAAGGLPALSVLVPARSGTDGVP